LRLAEGSDAHGLSLCCFRVAPRSGRCCALPTRPLCLSYLRFSTTASSPQGERDSKEEVAKVFALFDPDGNGRIAFRDLKRVVTELGEGISEEEMREMIDEAGACLCLHVTRLFSRRRARACRCVAAGSGGTPRTSVKLCPTAAAGTSEHGVVVLNYARLVRHTVA